MPGFDTIRVTITGDIQVTVPKSPRFMTTFVLLEQKDWFEDEMDFVRFFIRPGMRVLDIGANYGCYTLTVAKIIGDAGKLWAFEPTKATAACLRKSISANKFTNIDLVQAGLSGRRGKARFFTSANSELNSLSESKITGSEHESIKLLTLDHCQKRYRWDDMDFIKLDAEGEECNILRGGAQTLSSLSPLIMFELKHGDSINLPLIEQFESIGYGSYRLIPGLNLLVPFDRSEPFDEYLLNLFSCKDDKARQLEQDGILVRKKSKKYSTSDGKAQEYISNLAYGKSLGNTANPVEDDNADEYLDILNAYAESLSESAGGSDRFGFLSHALDGVHSMVRKGESRIECLSTFSRIAFDSGERGLGVKILTELIGKYSRGLDFEINNPFFPACRRYDGIAPGNEINAWLFSSVLEQWITKHTFSSYFSGNISLPVFDQLNSLGFIDERMRARSRLVGECFSQ